MRFNATQQHHQYQSGTAAVMILIVLLIVISTMVHVVLETAANTAMDIYGATTSMQAFYLAESGLEAIHYRLQHGESCDDLMLANHPVLLMEEGFYQLIDTVFAPATTVVSAPALACTVIIKGIVKQMARYIQAQFVINHHAVVIHKWQEITY